MGRPPRHLQAAGRGATLCTQQLCRKRLSKAQHVSTPRIASSQPKRGIDPTDVWRCTHTPPRVPGFAYPCRSCGDRGLWPTHGLLPMVPLLQRLFHFRARLEEAESLAKIGALGLDLIPLEPFTLPRGLFPRGPGTVLTDQGACSSPCLFLVTSLPSGVLFTPLLRYPWQHWRHRLQAALVWQCAQASEQEIAPPGCFLDVGGRRQVWEDNQLLFTIRHLATMTGGPKSSAASFLSELPPSLNHQALGRVKVLSHRMSR